MGGELAWAFREAIRSRFAAIRFTAFEGAPKHAAQVAAITARSAVEVALGVDTWVGISVRCVAGLADWVKGQVGKARQGGAGWTRTVRSARWDDLLSGSRCSAVDPKELVRCLKMGLSSTPKGWPAW